VKIQCGYEVSEMVLLHNLIVVKTCLCMFKLAPVTISLHQSKFDGKVEVVTLVRHACVYVL
jgi:hypothetical protein